jgi:hypothetical protein
MPGVTRPTYATAKQMMPSVNQNAFLRFPIEYLIELGLMCGPIWCLTQLLIWY